MSVVVVVVFGTRKIHKKNTEWEEYTRGIRKRHVQEAYARGMCNRNTHEEYARGRHKRKTQEEGTMENQPKAPIGNEQRRKIPSNRYIRTPTSHTTIQPAASPPRDVHPCTCNP
eukprot:52859-Ditylum_brightwellii.AAC.1